MNSIGACGCQAASAASGKNQIRYARPGGLSALRAKHFQLLFVSASCCSDCCSPANRGSGAAISCSSGIDDFLGALQMCGHGCRPLNSSGNTSIVTNDSLPNT